MLIYLFIFDLTTMFIFVFWQFEVPITLVSLIPAILNIYLLVMPKDKLKSLVTIKSPNSWTAFYCSAGLLVVALATFTLLFFTAIIGFKYKTRGYYPSIGWCFMQLYLMSVSLVNTIWYLSLIKLIYDLRKFYN